MADPTINFLSYNPTGIDNAFKAQWTREVMCTFKIDFASLQEHFKKNVGNLFNKQFPGYQNYVIPATRAPMQEVGRPKGGLAQLQSENIQTKCRRISCENPRIQAQILKFKNISLLWINTYFPTDPQAHFDDTELRKVLSDIEDMMDKEEFDHVLINGDINWHRVRQNDFTNIVEEFVEKIGLCSVWEKFPVSHTHIHTDHKSFSTLDHFLLDPDLLEVVEEAEALHIGDNLSRHSPIMMKVRLESLPARPKHEAPPRPRRPV